MPTIDVVSGHALDPDETAPLLHALACGTGLTSNATIFDQAIESSDDCEKAR